MPEQFPLAKAQLIEMTPDYTTPTRDGKQVTVQFNPESLKVSYLTKTDDPKAVGDERGNSPRQVVGSGQSKLSLQLWFDATAPGSAGVSDVRQLTDQVSYFMTPKSGPPQPVPPAVRFRWGTFTFDGLMDSLEQTLDYFSPDGRPLRANVTLGITGQLLIAPTTSGGASGSNLGPTPGTQPLTRAASGSSVQGLAAAVGLGTSWQAVASANGIENPRLLPPGKLLNLNVSGGLRA